MSAAPEYTITARVRGVWKKLSDWYGADTIVKNFGALPPKEWCVVIDDIPSRVMLDRVLAEIRQHHPKFPPRFPEFEAIVKRITRPSSWVGPPMHETLCEFVLRVKKPPFAQCRLSWRYLNTIDPISGERVTTGVEIPAVGDHPALRVMVTEMQTHID